MESINKRQGSLILYNTWAYLISIGDWGNQGYLRRNAEESEEKKAEMQGRINYFDGAF